MVTKLFFIMMLQMILEFSLEHNLFVTTEIFEKHLIWFKKDIK